jgi:hypothetical protein
MCTVSGKERVGVGGGGEARGSQAQASTQKIGIGLAFRPAGFYIFNVTTLFARLEYACLLIPIDLACLSLSVSPSSLTPLSLYSPLCLSPSPRCCAVTTLSHPHPYHTQLGPDEPILLPSRRRVAVQNGVNHHRRRLVSGAVLVVLWVGHRNSA